MSNRGVLDLLETVFVVLNNLLCSIAMVFKHSAMCRQHQLNIELLDFFLRLQKVEQRVIGTTVINANVGSNLWQQMVADDHDFILREIQTAVPSRMTGRPHNLNLPLSDIEHVAVVYVMICRSWCVYLTEVTPRSGQTIS